MESLEQFTNLKDFILWSCFILITILWALVVFFVSRFFNQTNKKQESHEAQLNQLNTLLQSKVGYGEISETYEWVEGKLRELRQGELHSMRTEMTSTANQLRTENAHVRSDIQKSIESMRKEIKADLRLLVDLIRGKSTAAAHEDG